MAKPKDVSLKLLIDAKRQSVLFAEAPEKITDILSDMLSQPLGTVVSLLRQQEMAAGSFANLCKGIEHLKLNLAVDGAARSAYVCPNICGKYDFSGSPTTEYSDDPHTVCTKCNSRMNKKLKYVGPAKAAAREGGVAFSYLITDDLQVMPLSTISIMTQLNRFGVKDVAALEEKMVRLGLDEAIKLLNASLQSKNALTDVFLTATPNANANANANANPKSKRVKTERDVVILS